MVSVAMLLMAGDAVGAGLMGLQRAATEIQGTVVGQNPNDEDVRAILRATNAILSEDVVQISQARFQQDVILNGAASRMRNVYLIIRDKIAAGHLFPHVRATVAELRASQALERAEITRILAHRVP